MKLAAIIAEYKPLHNGHLYHIEETKKITGADGVVVVMSGNFMQRGEPAVYDKFLRTKMALLAGADLVVELPVIYSTGSADYFAFGAAALLDALHCVDYLSFGCEEDDLAPIMQIASILNEEPDAFRSTLAETLKRGVGFAAARAAAVKAALQQTSVSISEDICDRLLSSPNATLAIHYCKALLQLHSPIKPVVVARKGSGYHDTLVRTETFSSATAIRRLLREDSFHPLLEKQLPTAIHPLFLDHTDLMRPLFSEDLSFVLNDRIHSFQEGSQIWDLTEDLMGRLQKHRHEFHSWDEWCELLKTRQFTHTRISRALLHLILGTTAQEARDLSAVGAFYARILGLNTASPIPALLQRNSSIPIITKLPDYLSAEKNEDAKKQLAYDLKARDLYRLLYWQKYHITLPDEYRAGIALLK